MKKIIVLIMMGLITYGCKMPRSNAEIEADSSKIRINSKEVIKVDYEKLKKLKLNFRTKKDEFSTDNVVFYYPKSAPIYINTNALYVYFNTTNDKANPLRFRFQYHADDWLFIKIVEFSIDGILYMYVPREVQRDNDGGGTWEWFDDSIKINAYDMDLLIALSKAKNAKMKIVGKYADVKTITSSQIKAIKETIELHEMLGGSL